MEPEGGLLVAVAVTWSLLLPPSHPAAAVDRAPVDDDFIAQQPTADQRAAVSREMTNILHKRIDGINFKCTQAPAARHVCPCCRARRA